MLSLSIPSLKIANSTGSSGGVKKETKLKDIEAYIHIQENIYGSLYPGK